MEMVADVNPFQEQLGRGKKPSAAAHRVLTHVVEGFVIQESNFPFTADDDDDDYDPLRNSNHDHNGDIDMEANMEADSPLSNDESLDNVFLETTTIPGHCEQCGCTTEVHHQRGPRRFCSTSCARRYSVSCSRKMLAYNARMRSARGRQHSSSSPAGVGGHRKVLHSLSQANVCDEEQLLDSPVMVHTAVQVNEFDTIHPTSFDWSRSEVEPLWLYEHVEAAKWSVNEVAAFISSLGCTEHADSFISEEIDGQALMLLKEEHMVVAMKMKLGPALKIVAKVNTMKREAMRQHMN